MYKIATSILFLINFLCLCEAQETFILTGTVKDSANAVKLANATIYIEPGGKGFMTNENGEFEITLISGSYSIQISFIGYHTKTMVIELNKSINRTFFLMEKSVVVSDVNITAKREDAYLRTDEIGTLNLETKEIEALPTLMGEVDIINAIKLTPGVQGGGEGNPGLYVRGGDAGQNLFLIDNMTLYNPSHLLGFFPVFNADIISNVKVIKGGIPAQYGGRASSVIDISMKEGNPNQFSGSGSIGLLSTSLTLESPINKNKGSLIVSGRRTYLNAIKAMAEPFIKNKNSFFSNTDYYFYDGSLKFRYNLTQKTKLFITAFGGQDYYVLKDNEFKVTNKMNWTNAAAAIRINHTFNNNFFANLSSSKTLFSYGIDAGFNQFTFKLFSGIDDWRNTLDFTYLGNRISTIKFGFAYTKHLLTPNKIDVNAGEINFANTNQYFSNEYSTYLNASKNISPNFSISGGIRASYFEHIGPYTHYFRNEVGQIADSTMYKQKEKVAAFLRFDPNLNWIYQLNKQASIKGSVSMVNQFIHLASVGSVSLPTDVWLPSTSFIKPQQVWQYSSGYFRNFRDNTFESSVEIYYKLLKHQVDFLNGVLDNFDNTKFENNILQGTGKAYGAEFFIKKKTGKTTGWISYTLSKTQRKFNEINDGIYFPAKYDRVHDFSFTVNHKLNSKWNLSAVFVYATGNAMTLPAGRYLIQGYAANHYTNVNSFRMPAYHRLDISATYQLKKHERFESHLNFSVYNAYNRTNPYFIYFAIKGDLEHYYLKVTAKQISLFPILPSVTWTFKF